MPNSNHDFQDIREAVRDLCSQFSGEYFRKVDEERGYPEEFVQALTEAGWPGERDNPDRLWLDHVHHLHRVLDRLRAADAPHRSSGHDESGSRETP